MTLCGTRKLACMCSRAFLVIMLCILDGDDETSLHMLRSWINVHITDAWVPGTVTVISHSIAEKMTGFTRWLICRHSCCKGENAALSGQHLLVSPRVRA